MGSLIKQWVGHNLGHRQIYHITVMPCYDKKLEAAREDFFSQETQSRDVDCVITASKSQKSHCKILLVVIFSRVRTNANKGRDIT